MYFCCFLSAPCRVKSGAFLRRKGTSKTTDTTIGKTQTADEIGKGMSRLTTAGTLDIAQCELPPAYTLR